MNKTKKLFIKPDFIKTCQQILRKALSIIGLVWLSCFTTYQPFSGHLTRELSHFDKSLFFSRFSYLQLFIHFIQ